MIKSLQILFGLVLILVLAYIAFLDVSTKIKDDLLTKTKVMFSKNNVKAVTATIKGEGLSMSRTLVLAGTAISDVERVRIFTLTKNIEGVCSIDNQITLYPVVPKAPTVPVVPKVPAVIKVPTIIEVPVIKKSTEPVVAKSTPTEAVVKEKVLKKEVVIVPTTQAVVSSKVASPTEITKVPLVPTVESKSIVVPTPITAISVPKVIEVEKMKLEGVK